jgi:hypothetical protein
MESKKRQNKLIEPSLLELSEKKSERTTFKLSKEASDDLEWLQKQYRLSAKELFDFLCSKIITSSEDLLLECIRQTANEKAKVTKDSSIRKTYVLSRGSIRTLTEISKQNKLSRDKLISNLICSFKEMVKEDLKNEQKRQQQALDLIKNLHSVALETENKLKDVTPGNPVLDQFKKILDSLTKLVKKINA